MYSAVTIPRWDVETGAYVILFQNVTSTRLQYIQKFPNPQLIIDWIILAYPDKVYKIGDIGPGGGKIFYDKGNKDGGWQYLEAASADLGKFAWATKRFENTVINTTVAGIGTGAAKTALILSVDANAPAAKACANYRNGGKDDWYLPCKEELNEMYRNKKVIGGFSNDWYWSSTEWDHDDSWHQRFSDGLQVNESSKTYKHIVRSVRPIRQF
jgi:hypothetical protein